MDLPCLWQTMGNGPMGPTPARRNRPKRCRTHRDKMEGTLKPDFGHRSSWVIGYGIPVNHRRLKAAACGKEKS